MTDTTKPGLFARAWHLCRLVEYDLIQVFAACAITGLITFFITEAL